MHDWLWYAILGCNLGSLAACWYWITWYWRLERQRLDHWWQVEQAQMARWQLAWRQLAQGMGATFHAQMYPDAQAPE